jgi:hypothetical protein
MDIGAVAVLDALGFKGIWQRHDPNAVLQRMEQLGASARAAMDAVTKQYQDSELLGQPWRSIVRARPFLATFSDTVIVSCAAEKAELFEAVPRHENTSDDDHLKLFALSVVSMACMTIAAEAAAHSPCFLFRGAIAVSEVIFREPSLILGPAIDEAAENEGRAEGAFIFYCQSAKELVGRVPISSLPVLEGYDVPVKRRGDSSLGSKDPTRFKTHVINPLLTLQRVAGALNVQERRTDRILYAMSKLTDLMLQSFDSDRKDVVRKRQHTRQFLNRAAGDLAVRIGPRFAERIEELGQQKERARRMNKSRTSRSKRRRGARRA